MTYEVLSTTKNTTTWLEFMQKNFVSEKAQHMRGMINNNNKQADKDMVGSHAGKTCFRKSSTYKA
jgi:hypothetical protein